MIVNREYRSLSISILLVTCFTILAPRGADAQELLSSSEPSVTPFAQYDVKSDFSKNEERSIRTSKKYTANSFISKKNQVSYVTSFLGDGRLSRPGNFLMSQFQYSRVFQMDSSNWFVKTGLGFFPAYGFYGSGINFSTPISIGYSFNRFELMFEYSPYLVVRFGQDKQLATARKRCLQFDGHINVAACQHADTWILPFEDDHFVFFKAGYTALNGFGIEIGIGMGRIYGHAFVLQKVTQFASRIQLNYNF